MSQPTAPQHSDPGRRSLTRSLVGAGVVLAAASALLSACGSSPAAKADPSTSTTLQITTTTVTYVPSYVTVAGHKVLMPTELHHEKIPATTAIGQNVVITTHGFEPYELYADKSQPVVFTNLTDTPEEVVLDNFGVRSGPIAPGKAWAWTTRDSISLVFSNGRGTEHGKLHMSLLPTQSGSSSAGN